MTEQVGNPDTGIGLHEATLAISKLLGPEEDTQDEAEALDPETGEAEEEYEGEVDAEDGEDGAEYDDEAELDEDDNEEEGTQELPDDVTVKVKVDGNEVEVTLAELRNGYSRTSDYTRKAQALAEERKAFQSEAETIRQERAQYAELLPLLQQQLLQQVSAEPDWDTLYNEDPIEAARLERQWRKSREEQTYRLQAMQAEQQRLAQEAVTDQTRAIRAFVEAERAKLPDVIPEWKDQATMAQEAKELRDWAVAQGLSEQEIESLRQASHVALLRKAMLYDKGRTKVQQAKASPKKGAKVIRPGSSGSQVNVRSTDVKKASQRLVRSGRISDAAALLDKLI
jgi:hypothetical protein